MRIVRKMALTGFVVVVPVIMTAALYFASIMLLHATNRMIDPQILWYAAAIELPVFLFFAVLEAKGRW
jgi:uncharacterized membrane protein